MNCINIFKNSQTLSVSVGNSYSEDQSMHIFLDDFQQGVKYNALIEIHQSELRREETSLTKNPYLLYLYILIT